MNYVRLIAILLLAIGASMGCGRPSAPARTYSPQEFPIREGSVDGRSFKYRVHVPPGHPEKNLPVMLFLHGSDDRGDDNESQLNGIAGFIRERPDDFDFIVVVPQCPAGRFWDRERIPEAVRALDAAVEEFGGDRDRLYLAGFSLGGYGVWHTAATFPHKFAALVPMSGRLLPRREERKDLSREVAKLASTVNVFRSFADVIGSTPVWIFHGSDDQIVPVISAREMDSALRNAGSQNVKYTEIAGGGHEPFGFKSPELFAWLRLQRRTN